MSEKLKEGATHCHTPGPWLAAAAPSSVVGWPVVAPPKGTSICDVSYIGYQPEGVSPEALRAYREECHANARLIAAAPDHALVAWAMCVQDGRWEEWGGDKGEFAFAGLRHATTLDEFGVPVLTRHLRAVLTEARAQSASEKAVVE